MRLQLFAWLATTLTLMPLATAADTYAYDARGRLIGACHIAGGDVRRTEYMLDGADNRTIYRNMPVVVMIPTNSSIWSNDGRFELIMQGDGNLVIYGPTGALWASNTYGSGANNTAVMQWDGNLVIYTQAGTPIWASATQSPCARMLMQSDGNLVIYDFSYQPLWASNTGGH